MLKDALKFLTKDSSIYGIAGAVTKLLAVLTVPIVVRILTKEEFGITNTVMSISSIFVGFIILGMDSSIARWFFNDNDDPNYRKKVVSIGFFIQIISLFFCLIIFILAEKSLSNLLFEGDSQLTKYWKIFMFSIPANAFISFSGNIFKWTFQRNRYLILTLGNSILNVALTLIFILIFKMGVFGVLLAPVISSNIFSFIGLYMNRSSLIFKSEWDKKMVYDMLKYGLPFTGIMIINNFLPSIDKLFLLRYVDMETIGEYSVALKIAGLLYLVTSAFSISFGPYAFSNWHKSESKKLFGNILTIFFAFTISLGVLLSIFGELVIQIFTGGKYMSALKLLPILILSISVKGISEFSMLGIFWSKKTYYNLLTSLIQVLSILAMNFILTAKYTVFGASLSLLISDIVYVLVTFYISNKFFKIEIDLKKILLILILSIPVHFIAVYEINSVLKYIIVMPYLWGIYRITLNKNQREETFLVIKSKLEKIITRK